jgi:carbon-monoxide dehydrogenase medium subunit
MLGLGGLLKSAAFDYIKASSLDHALELRSRYGADGVILAGGQSLIPDLNQRFTSAALLIDINGLSELSGIDEDEDTIRIGAMSRYREIETHSLIAQYVPMLKIAIPTIANPTVRNRGTIGGNIALADPSTELPACLCALDATIEISRTSSRRSVTAREFFKGHRENDIKPGEILTSIMIPKIQPGYKSAFDEIARRAGGYAICGAAAHAKVEDKIISDLRLVYFSVGNTPVLASNAITAIEGRPINEASLIEVKVALSTDLNPPDHIHCSGKLRMHYAGELAKRVIRQLVSNSQ